MSYKLLSTQSESLAFTTGAANGTTLKDILESPLYTKVFFDVRNDSDALYSLYGIKVNGIEDLQLLEFASRDFLKQRVNGLAKCLERDAVLSYAEKRRWQLIKEQGKRLFGPEHGGSYAVFDQRPLSPGIAEYCCQDVRFMPNLRRVFRAKLCDAWWLKIGQATQARIRESQSSDYDPKGVRTDRSMGPAGWSFFRPTMLERQQRSLLDVSMTATAGEYRDAVSICTTQNLTDAPQHSGTASSHKQGSVMFKRESSPWDSHDVSSYDEEIHGYNCDSYSDGWDD